MKVGVLIDELVSGGFQKVAIMEVKYLNELGYDAVLVVLHRIKNEGYQDLIKKNNIQVVRLSDRLPFYLRLNFRFPFFAFFSFFHIFHPIFIWRYIKRDNFDFFITHGTYTAFSSIAIKRKLKIPFASFIHDSVTYIIENKYKKKCSKGSLNFLIFIAKKIDKKIIKNSDFVFAFPDMIMEMKKVFPEYHSYKAIFNGCEILTEDKINFEKSNFAVSVTKWDQGKNFDFLLDLWNKLDVKIPLKVIGSFHPANLQEEMQKSINENKLDDIVELIGKVTEEELYEYYRNAKFMIHPCREAFGMTILEASASGCPAIFTSNSGVADLYPESIKKFLPKENNLNEYKKTIGEFLQMEKGAYEGLVREYYLSSKNNSWTRHCEQIIKLIC
jgi:glycosyltransferase involved in cell wall biosynthesis